MQDPTDDLVRDTRMPSLPLLGQIQPAYAQSRVRISLLRRRGYRTHSFGKLEIDSSKSLPFYVYDTRLRLLTSFMTTLPRARVSYTIMVRSIAGIDCIERTRPLQ